MKRQLTPAEQAKREERHAKFRAMWKQVANMPEFERIQIANKLGLITCDGHPLSLCNTMLIAMQLPNASVLGGFRQWINHGRAVRKGEHGAMIWVPTGGRKNDTPLDGATSASAVVDSSPTAETERHFIIGTVFDISQTEEIQAQNETQEQPTAELQAA